MNGEGKVKVLSIRLIRELMIQVPDLVTQMAIGNLYSLQSQKECLWKEKLRLEKEILTGRMTALMSEQPKQPDQENSYDEAVKKMIVLDVQLSELDSKKKIYEGEMKLLTCF